MPDGPVVAPPTSTTQDIDITGETSNTEAELNAKIDTELGLPPQETSETDTTTEESDDTTTTGDDTDGEASEEESTDDAATEEEVVDEEEVTPAIPSDEELFIEVEDANGVTHKISKIEDLPEDFEPKSNRQGLEILQQLGKLEAKIEAREADKAEAQAKADLAESQQRQLASWDKEVAELAKQKRIDAKDTERIDDVFKLMNEINQARAKAGNPNRITSFEDALDKFVAKEAADKAEADAKNDNERAKVKSSLIGRSSSAGAGEPPVYVAGSYRSIDDIPL